MSYLMCKCLMCECCVVNSLFLQVMIGGLESSGDIVSVSSCDNEIFILKGDRDIIRLSNSPEGLTNSEYSITTPNVLTVRVVPL